MNPVLFTRGLCAAAVLLSLAACGGGGSDAGALGPMAASTPAPTAQKPDGSTADASTADEASPPSLSWAP